MNKDTQDQELLDGMLEWEYFKSLEEEAPIEIFLKFTNILTK